MGGENTKINVLGAYREMDEKTPQGEVEPNKETLNPARVRSYLENHGFTVKNFDQRFNVKTAMDIVASGGARGDAQMHSVLQDAQTYLENIGLEKLMEQHNEAAFRSTLNKELLKRGEGEMEEKLNQAYQTYQTVRELCQRTLIIKEQFKEQREAEKIPAEKSLTEEIGSVAKDIKKNWNNLTGKEKLFLTGALTVGLVMFIRSKDEKVKAFREDLWGALKVAGIGVGAVGGLGIAYKLFTGESPLKSLNDVVTSTAGRERFLMDAYKTDAEKAAILRKSMVYMADKDFLDLARRYREAKAINSDEIRLPTVFEKDMSPKEVYAALDVFFSRYPVEKLEQRYRLAQPRPVWDQVIATEMAEDGLLSYRGNVIARTIENVEEYATRGWNWLLVGEGFGVGRYLYLKVFGKEGTDAEVKEWLEKNKDNKVYERSHLPQYFERLIPKHAAKFTEALNSPLIPGQDVQVSHDNLNYYVIAPVSFDIRKNERAYGEAKKAGIEKADAFLATQIPEIKDSLSKFRELPDHAQVRIEKDGVLLTCVRCPKKGSPEFDQKLHGLLKVPAYEDRRKLDIIFGPGNAIEYAALPTHDQERVRLRFGLASTQQTEIDKICKWFTQKYQAVGTLSVKEVYDNVFENDDDREKALEHTGIKPENQLLKVHLLKENEDNILDIEKDAAKDVVNVGDAYMERVRELQKMKGFKVRLAIGGDPAAQTELGYDPKRPNAKEDLLAAYKKECKQYVQGINEGRVK